MRKTKAQSTIREDDAGNPLFLIKMRPTSILQLMTVLYNYRPEPAPAPSEREELADILKRLEAAYQEMQAYVADHTPADYRPANTEPLVMQLEPGPAEPHGWPKSDGKPTAPDGKVYLLRHDESAAE